VGSDDLDRHGTKDGCQKQDKKGQTIKSHPDVDKMQVDSQRLGDGLDEEDELMKSFMGFTAFKSTQNTKVPGNNIYGVRKEKKTEYRQYMNRVGGFNRPLSPSR
jgi:U4/U6.U5 tri-snRNP-associated protein 3